MRAVFVAVVIGATLALLVAGVLVFAVWDACRVVVWSDMTVIMCRDYDPIFRVWPWPGWVGVQDQAPRTREQIGRFHGVSAPSWGYRGQASRAKVLAVFRGARS